MPRHSVGVVIGRSGEMIKKIQNDAGVRIQFKQGQKPHSCHLSSVTGLHVETSGLLNICVTSLADFCFLRGPRLKTFFYTQKTYMNLLLC